MSVTFSIEPNGNDNYYLTCGCGAWRSEPIAGIDQAAKLERISYCGDSYCNSMSNYAFLNSEYEDYDVNLSNANAYRILTWLGIDATDLAGEMTPAEFRQAVKTAVQKDAADFFFADEYRHAAIMELLTIADCADFAERKIQWA